jgi:hypothetical protein
VPLVSQILAEMNASDHADYSHQTVGYDWYFPPTPASVETSLAFVSADHGWALCSVIGATFRLPDGSDSPESVSGLCYAQDLERPLVHFAVQLSVEHADAQSLIRIGFWD